MDIAAAIGLIGAIVMVVGSMIYAGGVAPFVDIPSLVIVVAGTAFIVLAMKPLPVFLGHFKAMMKVFKPSRFDMNEVISTMVELSNLARKDGIMALEGKAVPDAFFEKGLQLLVDGTDEAKLVKQLKYEIKAMKARHEAYQGAVKAWIDIGPAMGMVGTLIGLVLMLGNMSDPKSIGPAMAVALLTTLYGALMANVIFAPILNKLEGYSADEVTYRELVIEGLRGIARGESARMIEDQMVCALDRKQQMKRKAA
ncbi:MotA [Cereibacter sphaeroides WS8N]|uniref:Motility protein A n=1 Tax=Cereibacter sphaeroides TaxID=1063 RepID=MOTA_CERSP|nr:MotA/TolQ/ExbB proton channel family protein [Cereibacter sphaeroides]Q53174.1 RecName: Full=Motility protein A; AltName: Full=Chemotaxis protein MotA [Cereibacter sphaeroides]EGJ21703.1 MotA [Cereibacter sphaeroides WS8N]CAA59974.1 MotA [Cereibacter sphaeroides]prf//2204359A motA gene [Cereibacter sphaeroides]